MPQLQKPESGRNFAAVDASRRLPLAVVSLVVLLGASCSTSSAGDEQPVVDAQVVEVTSGELDLDLRSLSREQSGIAAVDIGIPTVGTPVPGERAGNHIYNSSQWVSDVSGPSVRSLWWMSAMADPESPLARSFVDDREGMFDRFRLSLADCGLSTPTVDQLAEAIPYAGGPDRFWRQSHGFGILGIKAGILGPSEIDLANLVSTEDCVVQARLDAYPALSAYLANPGFTFVSDDQSVRLLQTRSDQWGTCLKDLGLLAVQIGDLISAAQGAHGISALDSITSLAPKQALSFESTLAVADWQCSAPDREKARGELLSVQQQALTSTGR